MDSDSNSDSDFGFKSRVGEKVDSDSDSDSTVVTGFLAKTDSDSDSNSGVVFRKGCLWMRICNTGFGPFLERFRLENCQKGPNFSLRASRANFQNF